MPQSPVKQLASPMQNRPTGSKVDSNPDEPKLTGESVGSAQPNTNTNTNTNVIANATSVPQISQEALVKAIMTQLELVLPIVIGPIDSRLRHIETKLGDMDSKVTRLQSQIKQMVREES